MQYNFELISGILNQLFMRTSACETSYIFLDRNIYIKHIIQLKIIFDKNINRLTFSIKLDNSVDVIKNNKTIFREIKK